MSHYDISYAGMTPKQAHLKAIEDIADYLGWERFNRITAEFRAEQSRTEEQFRLLVAICGVQGFPAEAWYRHCYTGV